MVVFHFFFDFHQHISYFVVNMKKIIIKHDPNYVQEFVWGNSFLLKEILVPEIFKVEFIVKNFVKQQKIFSNRKEGILVRPGARQSVGGFKSVRRVVLVLGDGN